MACGGGEDVSRPRGGRRISHRSSKVLQDVKTARGFARMYRLQLIRILLSGGVAGRASAECPVVYVMRGHVGKRCKGFATWPRRVNEDKDPERLSETTLAYKIPVTDGYIVISSPSNTRPSLTLTFPRKTGVA
jgi:hypothetical protein